MPDRFLKDPEAVLDYQIDWSGWLDGDTISASSWEVDGVTHDSDTKTDTTTTVWLSGGTLGETATATNHITTSGGREEDRTLTFLIRSK